MDALVRVRQDVGSDRANMMSIRDDATDQNPSFWNIRLRPKAEILNTKNF